MPRFINTFGNNILSVAICDRCKFKRPYDEIVQDQNIPALRVCIHGCVDSLDPYRLPARQPEKITIRFPRPDADIAQYNDAITTDPNVVNSPNNVTQGTAGEYGIAPETSEDDLNGNLDSLSP